jgi:putative spermidine/putrescine transport system permease protein
VPLSATLWLVFAAAFFVVPLAATIEFSLRSGPIAHNFHAYGTILHDPQFWSTLWVSVRLALETIGIAIVLLVPTLYWVHLRAPKLRPLVAFLCVLPFVVPPVVLVVGLLDVYRDAPQWFITTPQFLVAGYVVLAFPYVFFSLDAGFRAIDVRTLREAAQSLGAGSLTTLVRVVLPNLRAAALGAALLTFAIVLGEFTMANLSLFNTFSVYVNYVGQTTATPAAALAVISFLLTWGVMFAFVTVSRRRGASPAGGH